MNSGVQVNGIVTSNNFIQSTLFSSLLFNFGWCRHFIKGEEKIFFGGPRKWATSLEQKKAEISPRSVYEHKIRRESTEERSSIPTPCESTC
jgi:hypothetical protein